MIAPTDLRTTTDDELWDRMSLNPESGLYRVTSAEIDRRTLERLARAMPFTGPETDPGGFCLLCKRKPCICESGPRVAREAIRTDPNPANPYSPYCKLCHQNPCVCMPPP
jgi:hypothetical protein